MSIDDQIDAVFKALANPIRREICDALKLRPLTTKQLAEAFDPLDRTTSYGYSGTGALATVTDARDKVTSVESDEDGQPTLITDPLGHETGIDYRAGAAVAVTDEVDSLRLLYYDGEGVVTADPALVEQVLVRLFYSTPDGVQAGVIESQVALRNNIYAN